MGRLLDLDDFLDPKSLTPQELYKLQSDTWAQGADYERERIDEILNGWQVSLCKCDVCKAVREIKQAIKGDQK